MSAIRFGVAVVLASALLTVSACTSATNPEPTAEPLQMLADVAAERVQLADVVAAAKWGTDASISDPEREKELLNSAATKSTRLAIDPAVSIKVFTDQIEANKVVQYALYSRWSAHPDQAPRTRPDLGRIRSTLDQITDRLLTQLKATQDLRAGPGCATQLATVQHHAEQELALDPLHSDALGRALASVCRSGTTS